MNIELEHKWFMNQHYTLIHWWWLLKIFSIYTMVECHAKTEADLLLNGPSIVTLLIFLQLLVKPVEYVKKLKEIPNTRNP